jgi:hypothetical protein
MSFYVPNAEETITTMRLSPSTGAYLKQQKHNREAIASRPGQSGNLVFAMHSSWRALVKNAHVF